MAFGQSSGSPATGKQVSELLELLEAAGHSDFRDARGPMGFTQRQAGGKFSRDEADAFIEQLQSELYGDGPPAGSKPAAAAQPQSKIAPRQEAKGDAPKRASAKKSSASARKSTKADARLKDISNEDLAAELQLRGWVVLEP